jgi:hypothetical protein
MCIAPDMTYLLQDELHKEEESESPPTLNGTNDNMDINANDIIFLENSPKKKDHPVLTITLDSSTDSGESQ